MNRPNAHPCNSLIHGFESSFRILTKPYQTLPTTYPSYFPDPLEPSHLEYPSTRPTHPSVLPTHLILNQSTQITSQNPKITSLNPQITSLNLHAASEFWLNYTRPYHDKSDQLSQFWKKFPILTKFHNFNQILQFQQNTTILTKFYTFSLILQNPPDFTMLTNFTIFT